MTPLALLAAEGGSTGMPFIILGLWVLVLAIFTGFELISKVPPTLHTPLMSGANAISGIAVVGAIVVAGRADGTLQTVLGVAAITMAMINVIGGFMVTDRMLGMFRKR